MTKYPEGEIRTLPPDEQQKHFGKEVFVVSRGPQDTILKRKLSHARTYEVSWWPPYAESGRPISDSSDSWTFFPNYWMAYKHWLKLKNEAKP